MGLRGYFISPLADIQESSCHSSLRVFIVSHLQSWEQEARTTAFLSDDFNVEGNTWGNSKENYLSSGF